MMKKPINLITGIFLCTIILTVYIYISIQNKKPLCYEESCIGSDPIKNRCDTDAIITAEDKENKIELKYSHRCNASWAKAIAPVGSHIYVEDINGKQYGSFEVQNDDIKSEHFGNMGYGKKLKACIKMPNNNNVCTDFASK